MAYSYKVKFLKDEFVLISSRDNTIQSQYNTTATDMCEGSSTHRKYQLTTSDLIQSHLTVPFN